MSTQNENQYVQGASLSDLENVSPQLSERILSAASIGYHSIERPTSTDIPLQMPSSQPPARWLMATVL